MSQIKNLLILFCIFFCIAHAHAYADDSDYRKPSLKILINELFYHDNFNVSDIGAFKEFVQISHCELFQALADNQFEWQVFHERFLSQKDDFVKEEETKIVLPIQVHIQGYNFNTKSFDIDESNKLSNIGMVGLYETKSISGCSTTKVAESFEYDFISLNYMAQLSRPLDLYRIPITEQKAKQVFTSLRDKEVIYGNMYLTVEGALPPNEGEFSTFILTHLDKISFYANSERSKPFKTLYYNF